MAFGNIHSPKAQQSHKISEDYPERRASASNILANRRRPSIKRRAERNDCLRGAIPTVIDTPSLETIAARKHSQVHAPQDPPRRRRSAN